MSTEVTYKDTFKFEVFPEYEYTFFQKRRLLLFQGRIEHFQAAINYTDRFDVPNKINLLYMIGYSPYLKNAVERTKNNVVILAADIPQELMQIYDDYHQEIIPVWRNGGYINEDGTLDINYLKSIKRFCKAYETGAINTSQNEIAYKNNKRQIEIIEKYRKSISKFKKYFRRYILVDKLHPEKTIDHKDLDKIIKRYFPFGREQCCDCKAIFKPTTIKKAITCGWNEEDFGEIIGEKYSYDSKMLDQNWKRCKMDLKSDMRETGCCHIGKVIENLMKPPYGWDYDAVYAYCFARALKFVSKNCWYTDGVIVEPIETQVESFCVEILNYYTNINSAPYKRWISQILIFTEDGWRLSNRLAKMFDVEPIIPCVDMINKVCLAIKNYTKIPINYIDENLSTIFWKVDCVHDDFCGDVFFSKVHVYDTKMVRKLIDYFTWEKCAEINKKYKTINTELLAELEGKFPIIKEKGIDYFTTDYSAFWDIEVFENQFQEK